VRNERGDVVFGPDPFKLGNDPRPWLILSANSMPLPGEFICAGLTSTEYTVNYEIRPEHWTHGGNPPDKESYCSPWVLGTVKSGQIRSLQGTLAEEFTDEITSDAVGYLTGSGADC
jgi:hypothetical protein